MKKIMRVMKLVVASVSFVLLGLIQRLVIGYFVARVSGGALLLLTAVTGFEIAAGYLLGTYVVRSALDIVDEVKIVNDIWVFLVKSVYRIAFAVKRFLKRILSALLLSDAYARGVAYVVCLVVYILLVSLFYIGLRGAPFLMAL